MASPSPNIPKIEPYDTTATEDVLRLKDFERLIYDNPGWLMSVLNGTAEQDSIPKGVKEDIQYVTGDGAEDFQFDDATEDYLSEHVVIRSLIESRGKTSDADEKLAIRDDFRRARLQIFVQMVLELHEQDDGSKILTMQPKDTSAEEPVNELGNAS